MQVSIVAFAIEYLEFGDYNSPSHILSHILPPDVTHFVKHNSALDKEAARRATTFYLVDRRFDMLPSLLSSGMYALVRLVHLFLFL